MTQSEPEQNMPRCVAPVSVVAAWRMGSAGPEVLVTRRPAGTHMEGYFELPGGRIRKDERPSDAAARELVEETGLECRSLAKLMVVEHRYADRTVQLHAFLGEADPPSPQCIAMLQSIEHLWVNFSDLASIDFPPANAPITAAIIARLMER